jgi:hypothetical protein
MNTFASFFPKSALVCWGAGNFTMPIMPSTALCSENALCQNRFQTTIKHQILYGVDANKKLTIFPFSKDYDSIGQSKKRVVLTQSNVFTGMIMRTPLSNNNITGDNGFATIFFYTEPLTF